MTDDHDVQVDLGERSYTVAIRRSYEGLGEAVRALGIADVVVVTSEPIDHFWGDVVRDALESAGVGHRTVHVPDGEVHKTLPTYVALVDAVLPDDFRRSTGIVALGGGVVGDLAGFAAATVLRGAPLVQVPTTLLAMMDSSVGG